jgi:two-component system chemotaxis response regulator CheY
MPTSPRLPSQQPSAEPVAGAQRPSVLVIEPDASARSVLQVALARDGWDVSVAEHGEQALEQMAIERVPDVVVLESDLGGEDGFSFVSQLRGAARTAGVKVLLLARPGERDVGALAEVVGADGFIQKPAYARDVVALLRLELARREGRAMSFEAERLRPEHLLRAVLSTDRSGQLDLADGRGQVRFSRGRVTDVRFEGRGDLEALTRALAFTRGPYSVRLGEVPTTDEVICGPREIVQRVLPRLGRWARILERGLPLDAHLGVDFSRLTARLGSLPADVRRVVQLFDGHRSVEQVVSDSPLDEALTLAVATRLYLLGVIAPVEVSRSAAEAPRRAPSLFEPSDTRDAWFDAPRRDELEVADPAGGWQTTAPPELTQELAPELLALLEAFDIPVHLEAPELRGASPDVSAFLAGSAEAPAPALEAVSSAGGGFGNAELLLEGTSQVFGMHPQAGAEGWNTVTPLLTPALRPEQLEAGDAPGPASGSPAVSERVEPSALADVEATFFAAREREAAPPISVEVAAGRPVWPFIVAALGVLGLVVMLDVAVGAWRTAPAAEPVVAPSPPPEAPAPVVEAAAPVTEAQAADGEALPVQEGVVDVSENLVEARRLYEAGRYAQAKSLLEQVLTDAPRSATAWILLGLVRYDTLDIAGARAAADQVLLLDPQNARVQVLLATLHFDAGDFPAGRAALHRYLQLEPEGPFAAEAKALLRR